MTNKDRKDVRAMIERGTVAAVSNGKYIVASVDREGIRTPGIGAVSGSYIVGDVVYFFLFDDGTGKILCKL